MNLKERREELGLLQKDVSKITEIPQSTLSKYETGTLQVKPKYMSRLAKALNTSIEELFFSEDEEDILS